MINERLKAAAITRRNAIALMTGAAASVSLGGTAIAYGQMADGLKICAALPGDTTVHEGEDVGLTFAPADAHVFDTQGRVMRRRQAPALAA